MDNKKNTMKKFILIPITLLVLILASCSNSNDIIENTIDQTTDTSKLFDIRQSRYDFTRYSGTVLVPFYTSTDWTASVDKTRNGVEWCTIDKEKGKAGQNSLTVKVTDNIGTDDRNCIIRVKCGALERIINITQKGIDSLMLSRNQFEIPSEGDTITINVSASSNYDYYIDQTCRSWIHLLEMPKTKGLTESFVTYKIDPNTNYDKREGTISISLGSKSEAVKIYQAQPYILVLSQKKFNINSSAQDIPITISSTFTYDIEMPKVDWLVENSVGTKGMSTHRLNLFCAENKSYDNRTANICIYARDGSYRDTIVITQSAMLFDKRSYEFDENGGVFTVNLNSNVAQDIHIDADWIIEHSLDNYSKSFTIDKMEFGKERTAKITFTNKMIGTTDSIIVIQKSPLYFENTSMELVEASSKALVLYNETGQKVSWKSLTPEVATVDNLGNVVAKKEGSTRILANTSDGLHNSSCIINVVPVTNYIGIQTTTCALVETENYARGSLGFCIINRTSKDILLVSMQINEGVVDYKNISIAPSSSTDVYYSFDWIRKSDILFTFEYNGKLYTKKVSPFK